MNGGIRRQTIQKQLHVCVCVCVCATNSTNIPATKIGSKEAPESCEVHEHHILASLQIRVPFLSPPIKLLQLVENPQISLLFFSRPRFPVLAATYKPPENKFVHNNITKKSANQHQFLTISSTTSISYNFFNRLNVTEFLQNTISLTNSKAQFYTFFNKFKTWISATCIFHLQMC